MMRRIISATALGLALAASLSANPESWIYLLRSGSVEVADPESGQIVQSIQLPGDSARRIHPTPGGKFVFITYEREPTVTAIDAESHEVAGSQTFEFEPRHIHFSSMGEEAFITNPHDNEVRIYDHRRGEFTYSRSVSVGAAGTPVIPNRRATRLYRADNDGLAYVYLKTGQIIETIETGIRPESLGLSPDYRTFWAVDRQNGFITIIDEPRARVSRRVEDPHKPVRPVFFDSKAVFLTGDGKSLSFFNDRNFRLNRTIDLSSTAEEFVITGRGDIWSRNDAGITITDVESGKQLSTIDVTDTLGILYVVLRTDEGFACF